MTSNEQSEQKKETETVDCSIRWAKDPDVLIPIPWHCIQRMLSWISYSEGARPGSAFARDIQIVRECVDKELERTNNVKYS